MHAPLPYPSHGAHRPLGGARALVPLGASIALLLVGSAPPARAERGAAYLRVQVKPFGRCSLAGGSARTAPYRQRVPAGTHELLCRSGHVALAALVQASHGAVRDLVFDLTRAPGSVTGEGIVRSYTPKAGTPVGTLALRAKAADGGEARCAIDGGRLRPTPLESQLLPGTVSVSCQRGAHTLRAQVRVRRDERVQVTFDFPARRIRIERPSPPRRPRRTAPKAPPAAKPRLRPGGGGP